MFILSQGLYSFSYCPDNGAWGCTKSWDGKQTGQLTQRSQRCTYSIPYDVYGLGEWVRGCCSSGTGWASASRVVSNCIVHHLFCIFYYYNFYYYYFPFLFCPSKLSLSQPMHFASFFFHNIFSPNPTAVEGREKQVSSCVVLTWQLGLNQNTRSETNKSPES